MHICLLTHAKEFEKSTNTGQLLLNCPELSVNRILWQRTQPDEQLLLQLQQGNTALVYPDHPLLPPAQSVTDFKRFILLDGTWQETAKMLRQSTYLQQAPRVCFTPCAASGYALRRNRRDGTLCTAETVIELLQQHQCSTQAEWLITAFERFNHKIPASTDK